MSRYCAGYSRSRPKCDELEFGPSDVECPVCGGLDNHCSNRRGLCCSCYCCAVRAIGDAEFAAMDAITLVRQAESAVVAALRRGTYPVDGRNLMSLQAFARRHGLAVRNGRTIAQCVPVAKPVAAPPARKTPPKVDVATKYGVGFKSDAPKPEEQPKQEKPRFDPKAYMREYNRTHKEKKREWNRAHREHLREWQRKYSQLHLDKVRLWKRHTYQRHREKALERLRQYYWAHREERIEYFKRRYQMRKENSPVQPHSCGCMRPAKRSNE